jgi:hypothetical protein
MAVLEGFLELGLDAWLLVGNKTGNHARVVSFYTSPFFDYRSYADSPLLTAIEKRRAIDLLLGIEDFNHPYSRRISEITGSAPDLVLCHNLHGGYFDLRVLSGLGARIPVDVRLFDSWLQTGHCAYSLGCSRWLSGCGQCPDLTMPPGDLAGRFAAQPAAQARDIPARAPLCVGREPMDAQSRQTIRTGARGDRLEAHSRRDRSGDVFSRSQGMRAT